MEPRNNRNNMKENKGYNIFLDDTYIGHMVIKEGQMADALVEKLCIPKVMKGVLANPALELRAFEKKAAKDAPALMAIMDDILGDEPEEDAGSDEGNLELPEIDADLDETAFYAKVEQEANS